MGKVFLVGGGPGDPELMTLKAVRALGLADVVLVDELVGRGCLAHARADATVIEVGKRGGCRSTPQAFIEKLMVLHARQGRTVARLKGGDPFVFGRGGEEADAMRAQGIEGEVIPGLTAGTAVPAALGIPLTDRRITHGVTFVTGHGAELDWEALVRGRTTLVIYMGLASLGKCLTGLLAAGMPAATPACLVEKGTRDDQKSRFATVGTLSGEGFAGPALIVVGDVVRFAHRAALAPQARAA
jgi:uroporphyrin-III C-methyltransferase